MSGKATFGDAPAPLTRFLGCILGSLFSREEGKAEREFDELYVRSETGLGAQVPIADAGLTPRPARSEREPAVHGLVSLADLVAALR